MISGSRPGFALTKKDAQGRGTRGEGLAGEGHAEAERSTVRAHDTSFVMFLCIIYNGH